MPFEEGQSGNPAGRPKGAQNKLTTANKERIEAVLQKLDTTLFADIDELPPLERVKLWSQLQEYVRPKLVRAQVDVEAQVGITWQETRTYAPDAKAD